MMELMVQLARSIELREQSVGHVVAAQLLMQSWSRRVEGETDVAATAAVAAAVLPLPSIRPPPIALPLSLSTPCALFLTSPRVMAVNIVVFVIVTAFWTVVGLVVPLLLPKGFNRGVLQTCLSLTAVCCYMI